MKKEFWDEMREHDFLLIDASKRKIAIFPNQSGQVVLAVEEDGKSCISTICGDEVAEFLERFKNAAKPALEKASAIEADYAIFVARSTNG